MENKLPEFNNQGLPSQLDDGFHVACPDITCTASWINKNSHAFSFKEFVRFHKDSEYSNVANISPDELQDYADGETAFELIKDQDGDSFCTLTVNAADKAVIVGGVLVCDCGLIEIYGPANSGYLCTSRGSLIVEDLNLYGHLIDLRVTPVSHVDFRVFSKSTSCPVTTSFLGFHLFVKIIPTKSSRPFDRGDSLFSHFSPMMSPPANTIPADLICRKLDSLRTDLLALEARLKAHIDNEISGLREEMIQRFKDLHLPVAEQNDSKSYGETKE